MTSIILTRKQIEQLAEIAGRFEDTDNFIIESESTSGIGPTVTVRFDLFEKSDTRVDITDVSNW